jgi:hypothetical protein
VILPLLVFPALTILYHTGQRYSHFSSKYLFYKNTYLGGKIFYHDVIFSKRNIFIIATEEIILQNMSRVQSYKTFSCNLLFG